MNKVIHEVTERIIKRSSNTRSQYLDNMYKQVSLGPGREQLSCGNFAHGFAACSLSDKKTIRMKGSANIAIITAYNDMLSAHQPYADYPKMLKEAVREMGSTAQVAGGTPAMCDGITQGQPGMELSLFSRDHIAMSAAIALSHNMFDGVLCLGVCDKIVPGLVIGVLRFGHLPVVFVPAGPMASGIPNEEKAKIRKLYAAGKVNRETLLDVESKSYHSAGTCTFYGTANSNQLVIELMGLQLPGAAFINPDQPLRTVLTQFAAKQVTRLTRFNQQYTPLYSIVTEKTIVNGMVALLATGGSTNLTIHLIAIARAAGIIIDWSDFSALSEVTPLLARMYPNGVADVNHFHAAGGTSFLCQALLNAGLLHNDVKTIVGEGLEAFCQEPFLTDDEKVKWKKGPVTSLDESVLRSTASPFMSNGGIRLLTGNLGRSVIKISAVDSEHQVIEAPAIIFHDQNDLVDACEKGEMKKDFVAVVRFQGPKANGMPELHKLTPHLSILQDKGFKMALITDGRMSGASGKIPAAIHVSPEAIVGGPIAKIRDGDMIRLDAVKGTLDVLINPVEFDQRTPAKKPGHSEQWGVGRELFAPMKKEVSQAELGATIFTFEDDDATDGVSL